MRPPLDGALAGCLSEEATTRHVSKALAGDPRP